MDEKQLESKISAFFKKLEDWDKKKSAKSDKKKWDKKFSNFFEALFAILFQVIFLILFNTFYDDLKFLTSEFEQLVSIINFSIFIGIIISFTRLIIWDDNYKAGTNIVNNFAFLYIAFSFNKEFPIDSDYEGLIRIALIVSMFIAIAASFFEVFKILTRNAGTLLKAFDAKNN